MNSYVQSIALLLVLLNPFLLTIYLVDVFEKLERKQFANVMVRATLIATTVYCCFAAVGELIFSKIVQAEFASFQIFGGVIFLLIGIQFVFRGPKVIESLRGESKHLAGAIAMPILIGPGTISACVVIGKRHDTLAACIIILISVVISTGLVLIMKTLHDMLRPRNAQLIERYIDVAGRITSLYVGTVSVEMIMQGVRTWFHKF